MSFFNPRHTWRAARFSLQGLSHAIASEQAIRHIVVIWLLILLLFICFPSWPLFLALLCWLLVLAVELLNSSVERVCDLVSPNYNSLIKQAKDLASACTAVLVAANVLLWLALAVNYLFLQ
jgi:diacylglycerol kinase (ATP)